jgi:hypothetical protein
MQTFIKRLPRLSCILHDFGIIVVFLQPMIKHEQKQGNHHLRIQKGTIGDQSVQFRVSFMETPCPIVIRQERAGPANENKVW